MVIRDASIAPHLATRLLFVVQVAELRLGPRRYLTGKAKTPDHAAYGPVGGKIGYDGSCSPDQDQSDDGPARTALPQSGRDAHVRFSAQ